MWENRDYRSSEKNDGASDIFYYTVKRTTSETFEFVIKIYNVFAKSNVEL